MISANVPTEEREMAGEIVFIEDDPDDVFLIERACKNAGLGELKQFLPNGKEAVDYFSQLLVEGAGLSAPKLIFLDLNMPLMGGLEFLGWLRQRPVFQSIPVVVLTTSENPKDIAAAYRSGANAYIVKPTLGSELTQIMVSARQFWLNYNRTE